MESYLYHLCCCCCRFRQAVDRCFATAEALPVVFELAPNLDTYNALMHVLGAMRAVRFGFDPEQRGDTRSSLDVLLPSGRFIFRRGARVECVRVLCATWLSGVFCARAFRCPVVHASHARSPWNLRSAMMGFYFTADCCTLNTWPNQPPRYTLLVVFNSCFRLDALLPPPTRRYFAGSSAAPLPRHPLNACWWLMCYDTCWCAVAGAAARALALGWTRSSARHGQRHARHRNVSPRPDRVSRLAVYRCCSFQFQTTAYVVVHACAHHV